MHVAHFIRPILRGRDIKRYKYNFADKWLIATFPAKHYNIDNYPAVRDYLLTFEIEKLEQSGKKDLNGVKGNNARKKTNNKWFETQDSIAYWDDFNKQKIIFQEMVQSSSFILDDKGEFMCLDTARIITGDNLEILLSILNSSLFFYAIKTFYGGGGLGKTGVRMKHTFFSKFHIPIFSSEEKNTIKDLVSSHSDKDLKKIEAIIYKSFNLEADEINSISSDVSS